MWNYFYTFSCIYTMEKNSYVFFTFDDKMILVSNTESVCCKKIFLIKSPYYSIDMSKKKQKYVSEYL